MLVEEIKIKHMLVEENEILKPILCNIPQLTTNYYLRCIYQVLDDIATLKNQMLVEREERMSEDEQIVQAINDYTKALQDGLRIVNT
jgi:hypothetical protein